MASKLARFEQSKAAQDLKDEKLDLFFERVFEVRARAKFEGGEVKKYATYLQYEMAVRAEKLIETWERAAAVRSRNALEENSKLLVQMLKALAGMRF